MEYSWRTAEVSGRQAEAASGRTHPVVLDELLHVVLGEVIGLDVGLHKLFVRDGSQVAQLLQLHEELLEVQLHQRPALVAALLHVGVATGQNRRRSRRPLASLESATLPTHPPKQPRLTLKSSLSNFFLLGRFAQGGLFFLFNRDGRHLLLEQVQIGPTEEKRSSPTAFDSLSLAERILPDGREGGRVTEGSQAEGGGGDYSKSFGTLKKLVVLHGWCWPRTGFCFTCRRATR